MSDKIIKEQLFNKLDSCLKALGGYDVNSLMPLLYVIVAHYEGHLLSIIGASSFNLFKGKMHIQPVEDVDGCESELLKEIRNSVNEQYFEGQPAEIVFRFYESCNVYIKEYYEEIIEHIISYYLNNVGRYAGMSSTPLEIASLMAQLIRNCHPSAIYDPFAGLCTYTLSPELKDIPFIGQEINCLTKVVADIRLDAAQRTASLYNEDSTLEWKENVTCDVLASELPFGCSLNDNPVDPNRPKLLEDYVLYKFINTPSLKKAVLMVAMGTCFRQGRTFEIRKELCEKNWIECVIKLPAGILPYTGISTAILILNKEKTDKDVRFVIADDCIIRKGKNRILDTPSVLSRVSGEDKDQSAIVPVGETFMKDCSFDPSKYVQSVIEVLPGQRLVKFSSLATRSEATRNFEETRGRVLLPEHMCGSITEMQTREISIPEIELGRSSYIKICNKSLIFNVRGDKFFIKKDVDPIFVSPNYNCFSVIEDKCIPEYLAECVVSSKELRESVAYGAGMPRIDWKNLLLPVYENLESQRQIVQRIYRQEQNELKKKLESLQVLGGKSSDLIHNLGITFTRMSAGIGKLMDEGDNIIVNSLNDNLQFALRQINSTGADFAHVQPEMERVNLIEVLEQYIKGWRNFGYNTFDILPIKEKVSRDTKVEIDRDLFFTMLDCIFINAHQHGFNKRGNSDNKVWVEVEGVVYNEEKYIRIGISNNGNPLPDSFTVRDFVARGVVGINSYQDGIGGDHVCKIAHHFGGLVSIDSDNEWLTFNILLPVYLTSNDTKFNDYECECV